jgi:OOP family OmpA-OmpF porin
MKGIYTIAIATSVLLTTHAAASNNKITEGHWYVGGALGNSQTHYQYQSLTRDESRSSNGFSGKLFGGYQFTDYLATEISLSYLGGSHELWGNNGQAVALNSGSINVVGLYPIENTGFSLLGSLGIGGISFGEYSYLDGLHTFEGATKTMLNTGVGVRYAHPSLKQLNYDLKYEHRFFDEHTYQADDEWVRFNNVGTLWFGVSYHFF